MSRISIYIVYPIVYQHYQLLLYWLKPLQPLYMQKMSIPAWLLFLGVIFTVEYYWFLGFRFWSGAFVFTGFYLRYLNSGAVKYLWLSALCICFHYSLLALCVAAVLNLLLRYRFKVYYLILIVSFIVLLCENRVCH